MAVTLDALLEVLAEELRADTPDPNADPFGPNSPLDPELLERERQRPMAPLREHPTPLLSDSERDAREHYRRLFALARGRHVEAHDARCALPADCEGCARFVCTRCERVTPWEQGAADDTPALCDDCADTVQDGWHDSKGGAK